MLLDLLAGRRTGAIIGLTKNTGKTTAFNHLVRQAHAAGISLGLTSIGRNGERWDSVTRERKPLIWAPEGSWVATAAVAIAKSDLRLRGTQEIMGSSFGPILAGQVATPGYVELIGPQTSGTVRQVTTALHDRGAEMVLIDGTFGRRFTAAAALCDGLVIATGATAGNNLRAVVERTRYLASLFRLPAPSAMLQAAADVAAGGEQVALLFPEGHCQALPFETALGHGPAIAEAVASQRPAGLFLPGAFTNGLATELTMVGTPLEVVVSDPAALLLDGPHARRLAEAGVSLRPRATTPLLAVTVNPYKGAGVYLPDGELQAAIAEAVAPIPVINVAHEGAILAGQLPDEAFGRPPGAEGEIALFKEHW